MPSRTKSMLATLASIRLNFNRKTQVIYKAPGFLNGVYMLEKKGNIGHEDLVKHAIDMRYGVGVRSLQAPCELNAIRIEIVAVVV